VRQPQVARVRDDAAPVWPTWPVRLAWLIVGAGALLRLRVYLADLSLWGDEACLAIRLLDLPYDHALAPWVRDQVAPSGFVLLVKAAVAAFGASELALRLVPLLSGLAALPLFLHLSRRVLDWPGGLLALLLFCANPQHIRYAAEFKHYSLDALVTCGLLLLAVRTERSARACVGLLAAGSAAVWLSYPSVFVLGAIALVDLARAARPLPGRERRWALANAAAWAASFGASYLLTVGRAAESPELLYFWKTRPGFWPLLPITRDTLLWPLERLPALMADPGGFPGLGLAASLLLLVGILCISVRSRRAAVLLLLPLALAMGASALSKYPVFGRLMLFAVPLLMLMAGEGGGAVLRVTPRRWLQIPAAVLVGALLSVPLRLAAEQARAPRPISDARAVLALLASRRQPGDSLYVFPYALPVVTFYGPRFGLADMRAVTAFADPRAPEPLAPTLAAFASGDRVWFVMANVVGLDYAAEERRILGALEARGTRGAELRAPGAAAYLYTFGAGTPALSARPPASPPARRGP
jgi:hypothetical protein